MGVIIYVYPITLLKLCFGCFISFFFFSNFHQSILLITILKYPVRFDTIHFRCYTYESLVTLQKSTLNFARFWLYCDRRRSHARGVDNELCDAYNFQQVIVIEKI